MLLFLIVAIAAFNVVSTLVMVVVDKHSDIAILRTPMGFALAPTKDDEVIKPDVFNVLPEATRKAFQEKISEKQRRNHND